MAQPNIAERHGYIRSSFATDRWRHDVYTSGEGPLVLLLHEMPTFSWRTVQLADHIRDHGYRVAMPILVGGMQEAPAHGPKGAAESVATFARSFTKICVSREFVALLQHRTSPVTDWLIALAKELVKDDLAAGRKPRVGVIGMCFSGGFALATAIDPIVHVAVASQPALPFATWPFGMIPGQKADLGLSRKHYETIRGRRNDPNFCIRAFRYDTDAIAPGERVERIEAELGPAARLIRIPAKRRAHSVLTDATDCGPDPDARPQLRDALATLIASLDERLRPGPSV